MPVGCRAHEAPQLPARTHLTALMQAMLTAPTIRDHDAVMTVLNGHKYSPPFFAIAKLYKAVGKQATTEATSILHWIIGDC